MRITIADVAARAGVSKTTVSRVLNAKDDLDERTAARVRQVIEELGYVPSSGAVGLARGRTRVVGVLVPSLQWPWMGDVIQGAVDTIEASSYGMLLFTCTRGDESMRKFASQVSAKSFDGLVVIEPEGTLDYIASLHAGGLPVVMIDDRVQQPQFPSVGTTNRDGGRAAAEHLLVTGRRRPVVIQGHKWLNCTTERLEGFASAFDEAGVPVDPALVVDGEFTFEGGRLGVEALLDAGHTFDAVFAHNDLSAGGAMRTLRSRGLRVPQDVAVVGFDDIEYATHTDPAMTTVRQPLYEMGSAASRMLLELIDGPSRSDDLREVIPTSLIVRDSTIVGGPAVPGDRELIMSGLVPHQRARAEAPLVAAAGDTARPAGGSRTASTTDGGRPARPAGRTAGRY